MSDDQTTDDAPKKKKGKGKLLIIIGALVVIGAGAGGGAAAMGLIGGGHKEGQPNPNEPQLVPVDEGAIGKAKYKASYLELENTFTSNLADTDGFMQVGLGVSTFYDQRVLDNLKNNELPVRSAVLMTLANQEADYVSTPQGKEALQKELREAINKALVDKTGFGGIADVYFTSFVIQ